MVGILDQCACGLSCALHTGNILVILIKRYSPRRLRKHNPLQLRKNVSLKTRVVQIQHDNKTEAKGGLSPHFLFLLVQGECCLFLPLHFLILLPSRVYLPASSESTPAPCPLTSLPTSSTFISTSSWYDLLDSYPHHHQSASWCHNTLHKWWWISTAPYLMK